jgi:cell division transport system permease protein
MIVWTRHHRQALAAAVASLLRAPLASLMTIGVIGITLALPAGLHVVIDNLGRLTGGWAQEAGEISVFLKSGTSEATAGKILDRIKRDPDVARVQHVTPGQALRELRARPGFGESLKALDTNPLPHLLVVRPASSVATGNLDPLRERLAGLAGVDQVVLDLAWVRRLQSWLELAGRFAAMLAALLALGVLLITSNTIRLAVANRRDEIAVTKLVGGTNAYIRRPFLYGGALQGLLGGLLAWLLTLAALWALSGPIGELTRLYQSGFAAQGLPAREALWLVAGGAGLGWLGAFFASQRHLSSIEPT